MSVDLLGDDTSLFDPSRFPPPHDFQAAAHEVLRDGARNKNRRQLLMAPTGAGKTYLALRAISEAMLRARRALFICDRLVLIDQTSKTADRYGLHGHGIYQADHWRTDPNMPFQIASTQTMDSRGPPPGRFDLAVIDECHSLHRGWLSFLEGYEGHVIGLSATPFTRGLGKVFTNLVNAATMGDLVDKGVLVPLRVLTCTRANMKGAKLADGEWTQEAAAERGMAIVGRVVPEYVQYGEGRKAIYFGATIRHCEQLCKEFNEAGIMAAVFCADTTPSERAAILAEFEKPESVIRVLVSVEALAKGFNVPDVQLIGDCRPLRKGLSAFVQLVGRGLRSAPDKVDCILLDHSGNIVRFAEDFEDLYWNGLSVLDDGERYDATARKDIDDRDVRSCPKCGYRPFQKRCISCGYKAPLAATVKHEASDGVREIFIGKKRLADDRQHLYDQFVSYCLQHGNPQTAKGRAAHLYREAMGTWPDMHSFDASARRMVPVTDAVRSRVRAHMIRFKHSTKGNGK